MLVPEGRLIVSGFNPLEYLWGLERRARSHSRWARLSMVRQFHQPAAYQGLAGADESGYPDRQARLLCAAVATARAAVAFAFHGVGR